jgi:ATP-dependent exoDNAse (exonuclease V) beta subunit
LDDKEKIAILVRYNYQIAEIKEICDKHGINIETEIGGELFRIDPTIDLFKLVLALKYNQSPKYLYNLYTTSYVSEVLPKVELWDMSKEEIKDYLYNNLPKSLSKWNEYIQRLRTEPVLKVLRDLVDEAKPWDIFSKKINAEGDDVERCESYYIRNLDQLFEKLVLASNTDYLTINKLSNYLEVMILTRREEEARESYDIEKSTSKIICTTVHKSKGLEFDTVLLPHCEFDISCAKAKGDVDLIYSNNKIGYRIKGNDYDSTAFENDLYDVLKGNEFIDRKHEETRILYVALTRAIKKVVYLTDRKPNRRGYSDCWKKMIEEV